MDSETRPRTAETAVVVVRRRRRFGFWGPKPRTAAAAAGGHQARLAGSGLPAANLGTLAAGGAGTYHGPTPPARPAVAASDHVLQRSGQGTKSANRATPPLGCFRARATFRRGQLAGQPFHPPARVVRKRRWLIRRRVGVTCLAFSVWLAGWLAGRSSWLGRPGMASRARLRILPPTV